MSKEQNDQNVEPMQKAAPPISPLKGMCTVLLDMEKAGKKLSDEDRRILQNHAGGLYNSLG